MRVEFLECVPRKRTTYKFLDRDAGGEKKRNAKDRLSKLT